MNTHEFALFVNCPSFCALDSRREEGPVIGMSERVQALLESILRELDWPYRANARQGVWEADFESREERWPPIQELTLHEGSVGFRLGPIYGPTWWPVRSP